MTGTRTDGPPDNDADPNDQAEYVAAMRAASPDASPIVHECVRLWDHHHDDDDGECVLVPATGCGWWRPATEDEYGRTGTCPNCGGASVTHAILSVRDEVRARAAAAGIPVAIAFAMAIGEMTETDRRATLEG